MSIGAAFHPAGGAPGFNTIGDLFSAADKALFRAKQEGCDRTCVAEAAALEPADRDDSIGRRTARPT